MSNSVLFRAGRHLVLGEKTKESDLAVQVETRCRYAGGNYYPIQAESVKVARRFVVHEDCEAPPLQESKVVLPFAALIHESVMPLVASFRELDLSESLMVAYERQSRGLGFLSESGGVDWYPLNEALLHEDLGQLLALEALKPVLSQLGLYERAKVGTVLEQSTVIQKPLHVYMKETPFRDISQVHEGTHVAVVGYDRGCALIEADSEPFWVPLEESNVLPTKKDDHYYFSQDGDRDYIPDPLNYLPSKVGHGAVTGSAHMEDNWNAQAEEHRVAGNFYGYDVDEIPNTEYGVLRKEVPDSSLDLALSALRKGVHPGKIVSEMIDPALT